jgi:hypothetical protein
MKRLMVAALAAALFTVVGCQKNQGQSGDGSDPKMMSGDACSMCPGVQQATADNKCPSCGMALNDPKMMSSDACSHCPGIQKANAEGKCEECAAKSGAEGQPAQ